MNISVIGFGYIGSVMSAVLASNGHNITSIDSNVDTINKLNQGLCDIPEPGLQSIIASATDTGHLKGSLSYSEISKADVVLITVGTPLSNDYDADLTAIRSVFSELRNHIKENQIIMVKSTVPPGTTRKMYDEYLFDKNIYLSFSPERLAEGNAILEFTQLPIVVGGINQVSTSKCGNFWRKILNVDVMEVSSCETAEMVKLADNQWIDLNIALANELAILCDALPHKIDVIEVIKGANSLKKGMHYVNILYPSIGVGGYCLTKDPWFLDAMANKLNSRISLPASGRKANELMPKYAFDKVNSFMINNFDNHKQKKIAVLGYSFKNDSGDTRFTPMKYFLEYLIEEEYSNIHLYDSMVDKSDVLSSIHLKIHNDYNQCIDGASCLIYGAAHSDIKNISISEIIKLLEKGALVFDGRLYMNKRDILDLQNSGIQFEGIGRRL